MLTIGDACGAKSLGRREFLKIGSLGLGGLSLPGLLAAGAQAGAARPITKGKSVVYLFMQGGPSQIETFDPKMTAPAGIRSVSGEIATSVPGLTFGPTFERLATMADRLAIVRSFVPGDSKHDVKPLVSEATNKASLGAIYSRVAGSTHPVTGMPTSALLYPRAVDANSVAPLLNFGNHGDTGLLGRAYAPFAPGGEGQLQEAMRLNLPRTRLDDRRALLAQLDRIHRQIDANGALTGYDHFQEQGFQTILSGVADAFDLSKEDPRTVARYDTSKLVTPAQISRSWKNYERYVAHGQTLGKLMLLARRLCEAGCGFITITTDFVWDNHADVNNAGVEEGMRYCGQPFDHAVSTFLEDIQSRGLADDILLVCSGEMGRTPKVNARGGRDHWGNLGPLMLAGGGLPRGKVIGQSTRDAGEPLTEPVTLKHLTSTILQTVFNTAELRLAPGMPSDLTRMIAEGDPIPGLG